MARDTGSGFAHEASNGSGGGMVTHRAKAEGEVGREISREEEFDQVVSKLTKTVNSTRIWDGP